VLVSLCAVALVLLAFAVFLSDSAAKRASPFITVDGVQLSAATWLGDIQGVPAGLTGRPYPDFTTCYVNGMKGQYGMPSNYTPACRDGKGGEFFSALFSAHKSGLADGGKSVGLYTQRKNESLDPNDSVQLTPVCPSGIQQVTSGESGQPMCDPGEQGYYDPNTFQEYYWPFPPSCRYSTVPAGYDREHENDCDVYRIIPSHWQSLPLLSAGSPSIELGEGDQLTLEWSCLPQRKVLEWRCSPSSSGLHFTGNSCGDTEYTVTKNNWTISTGATGGGAGFTAGAVSGAVTISPVEGLHLYTLRCEGIGAPALSIPVDVGGASEHIATPTVGITGNSQNPVSVSPGTSVAIRGTYVPATGDTLLYTSLNDFEQNALPGVAWTPASSPKSYTFTPSRVGSYIFYPAVQTMAHPVWSDYGKSLTVTVSCPANSTERNNGTCQCVNGYSLQAGVCVADGVCDVHETNYPSCTCEVGYERQGGQCQMVACEGAHEVAPSCTCEAGYVRTNGECIQPAVISILANGTDIMRVRPGTAINLIWSTANVAAGSCTVRNSAGVVLSTSENRAAPGLAAGLVTQDTFTLTCQDEAGQTVSDSARVSLLPEFIEN
jgi:hypothetical protein